MELFENAPRDRPRTTGAAGAPLAERARPATIERFSGQRHLLGEGKALGVFLVRGTVPSMIFWGPPGCGKTTLARLISANIHADFYQLNAVSSGVQELRKVIGRAALAKKMMRASVLFIDEIHRFNKAQQDALLHSVEDGTLTLIGATTENPSFEVISPLLSRCRVFTLEPLSGEELEGILAHVLSDPDLLGQMTIRIGDAERKLLFALSSGDARQMLNGLEAAVALGSAGNDAPVEIGAELLREAFQTRMGRYDKSGEEHYNVISAFIKSIRGSDPDAAVYWLARMLASGEDPKFIARRMVVLASEDIGNADPGALPLATACFAAVDFIGMPEARIVLAQAAAYLSAAPKSNSAIRAIDAAMDDVRSSPPAPVPLHLRNAPTALMKGLDYGTGYRYPHDAPGNFTDQQYLPDAVTEVQGPAGHLQHRGQQFSVPYQPGAQV
ncbi:MAG TPA: replication-associated recombination protein A, partial [Bacteroidota bacterium]|nr:replication-associated recombination protein A [Bacteroidota bacterium]